MIKQNKLSLYRKTSKHIQSKKFYEEANDIESGWGDYLYSIDKLRESVDLGKSITLNDALWIGWAEFMFNSDKFKVIEKQLIKDKLNKLSFKWEYWKSIFTQIIKDNSP